MVPAAPVAASGNLAGASCGFSSTCCSIQQQCRSVVWLQQHLLQHPATLQGPVAPAASVAASTSCAAASCGSSSTSCSVQQPCRNVLWLQQHLLQRLAVLQERPAVAASSSLAGASCGSGSTCCSVQQPCRTDLCLQQYLLQHPAALQERPVAPAAPVAAPSSLAGASCGSSSTCCSVQQPCRSVLWLWQHLL